MTAAATTAFDEAILDHVAFATADLPTAYACWLARGGAPVSGGEQDGFSNEQVRLRNDAKIELLSTSDGAPPGGSFIDHFLSRFGGGAIHHVTIKVASLPDAADAVAAAGFDVTDYAEPSPSWHEFFLRPSQVGGLIAQVAWTPHTDAEWAADIGRAAPPRPKPTAPILHAVRISSVDLAHARATWELLGATVVEEAVGLRARWPGSPLELEIVPAGPGERPAALGLVMSGVAETARADHQPPILAPLSASRRV